MLFQGFLLCAKQVIEYYMLSVFLLNKKNKKVLLCERKRPCPGWRREGAEGGVPFPGWAMGREGTLSCLGEGYPCPGLVYLPSLVNKLRTLPTLVLRTRAVKSIDWSCTVNRVIRGHQIVCCRIYTQLTMSSHVTLLHVFENVQGPHTEILFRDGWVSTCDKVCCILSNLLLGDRWSVLLK